MLVAASAKKLTACSLCELTTLHPLTNAQGDVFCCPSCREVAALLAEAPAASIQQERTQGLENNAEITLALGGMWCSSCAWLVGEQLKRTKGVVSAEVSFIQRQACLAYDATITNPKLLKKRVRSLGYQATLPNEKPRDEEESFYTRLLIGGVMVLHDMVVGAGVYGRELLGWATPETAWLVHFFQIMMLATSLPVLILLGLPILRAGLASLLRLQPNLHTLIAIGTFSAFALSVRNLSAGSGGLYFDTATMLIFLVSIGHWLEMQAHKSSGKAVERLLEQMPSQAVVVADKGDKSVLVSELKPGQRVRVRPGERFPVDGLIAVGEGDVDESLLTGEPKPATRCAGEAVKAGTINLDGSFEVIATAVGASTTAGQIGRLLHEAMWNRSPVERLADKLAAWMTPIALALATSAFLIWNYFAGLETGLLVALSVLLIACPCALGLATPLTLWLALGRAAQSGAILRSAAALERLASVQKVFFDKTGTLTQLPMQVCDMIADMDEKEFLQIVASVENASEHPTAKAIVISARGKKIELSQTEEFKALPGMGVSANFDGKKVFIGSARFMSAQALTLSVRLQKSAEAWKEAGRIVVYAGWAGNVVGLVGLGETIRSEVSEALERLQARGLELGVLTGDEKQAGARWQKTLGIPVHAGLSPDEKTTYLQGGVAMVGDGVNDAPALAAATVGLAMYQGADVASAAADIVLMRADLRVIPWLIDLAREAMKRVRQNLGWAFIYNIIGIGLAMAGLMKPVLAALAMVLSSVFVTANAMKINNFELMEEKHDP